MRNIAEPCALLFTLALGAASAQTSVPLTPQGVQPGATPVTGARPDNDIGTGASLPLGTTASNIDAADTRSLIATNLPSPDLPADAPAQAYLIAARNSLDAGKTGEAQQSLEMAETRLLNRSVPRSEADTPSTDPVVAQITQALRALAAGDNPRCLSLIGAAIPNAAAAELASN